MPVSKEFTTDVAARLSAARPNRYRPMFGGLGFYCEEVFFAVGDDDRLYFKVSPETAPLYEAKGMGPWMMGDTLNDKYRELPAYVLADLTTLGDWIDAAVHAARAGKKKR